MYLDLANIMLTFVSEHAEQRWHRQGANLYLREITERDEARNALLRLVTGEITTYTYEDYLWGRAVIHAINPHCFVVTTDGNPYGHNEQLTADLQARVRALFNGWTQPSWNNTPIGSREVRLLGRVQPERATTGIELPAGHWFAFGPDVLFLVVDSSPHSMPTFMGKVWVFRGKTGGKDKHGQPVLHLSSDVEEPEMERYARWAHDLLQRLMLNKQQGRNGDIVCMWV